MQDLVEDLRDGCVLLSLVEVLLGTNLVNHKIASFSLFFIFYFFWLKPNLSQTSKYNINREQGQHVSDRGEAGFVGFVSTS